MSYDVLALIQEMNICDLDLQLVIQCAPLLSRLKYSNLLLIPETDIPALEEMLQRSDVEYEILFSNGAKATILLYRGEELLQYLSGGRVHSLLGAMGYSEISLEAMLQKLSEAFFLYQQGKAEFPHELGLFLGYPVEDVVGFIQNRGQNFLYTGYWKVYTDLEDKLCLFEKFEIAQKLLLQFLSNGGKVSQILRKGHCNRLESIICA